MYKTGNNDTTHSTGSFLQSAPVELTSKKGYDEFMVKQEKHYGKDNLGKITTILKDNDEPGYLLRDGEVIATVQGELKDHLMKQLEGM